MSRKPFHDRWPVKIMAPSLLPAAGLKNKK
jgi:hypothetical protein